ncbi:hypothetical protein IP78_10775 [Brevundimonas sp. AAP58]|uniref:hypothetical protein n=1 Tax=Brevundimonas sp. AAP58 TaxID=1523422 RepID=UPI0006B936AC|nr:hypothetical protein [Brevundimonas sp. AAP58]KPF78626.1 hypothetical protein IP78_10775 [Brevundimonas sp. AAP58]
MTVEHLASFCLVGDRDEGLPARLTELVGHLAERNRHYEVILVIGEAHRPEVLSAGRDLARLTNLRILIVADGTNPYRRRRLAAAEALGDVVVLTDHNEAARLDLTAFAEQALTTGRIVMGARRTARTELLALHGPLRVLSGYRVDTRDLRTIALPRTSLTRLLARPTAGLDLRFEAKRAPERYVRKLVDDRHLTDRLLRGRRIDLLVELISASGPRFLKGFALIAVFTLIASIGYAAYAVGALLLIEQLQPGWFTISMALSGLTAFLSLWAAIGSLAQARLLELIDSRQRDEVIEEIGAVSFFREADLLNVALNDGSNGTSP